MSMLRMVALAFVLTAGCSWFNPDYYSANESTRDFFRLPTAEQRERFRALDLEHQYELLVFGIDAIHPPAAYLATEFAEQGEVIVPLLKKKLASEQRELAVRDIAWVLSEMDGLKIYRVSQDAELMRLLGGRANAMKGISKRQTLELMARLH